jgi:hypothetical protein
MEVSMRALCVSALAILGSLAIAAPVAAQGATGFPMGDVGQVLRQAEQPLTSWAPPPGPLKRLSKASKAWIRAETERQVAHPRDAMQVRLDIEKALADDVGRRARRERIAPFDYYNAILFQIMLDAEVAAERNGDAARLAQARAHREWAGELQSQNSLYMSAM